MLLIIDYAKAAYKDYGAKHRHRLRRVLEPPLRIEVRERPGPLPATVCRPRGASGEGGGGGSFRRISPSWAHTQSSCHNHYDIFTVRVDRSVELQRSRALHPDVYSSFRAHLSTLHAENIYSAAAMSINLSASELAGGTIRHFINN